MVGINDSFVYTEDDVSEGYEDGLPDTIHIPSLEKRVEALEEEVASLRNQISNMIRKGV